MKTKKMNRVVKTALVLGLVSCTLSGCQGILLVLTMPTKAQIQSALCARNAYAVSALREPPLEGLWSRERPVNAVVRRGWCPSNKVAIKLRSADFMRSMSSYTASCDDVLQPWLLGVKKELNKEKKDQLSAYIHLLPKVITPYGYWEEADAVPLILEQGLDVSCNLN